MSVSIVHACLAASFCLTLAQPAWADVVYKCGKGSKVAYQDEPCKPGTDKDNVLTPRNAKGTMNYVRSGIQAKSASGTQQTLESPRFADADMEALEEKQRLLGKPSIKEQLAMPTAIESRTRSVWNGVKQWFSGMFD